jgi:multidrug resistance efflux pump
VKAGQLLAEIDTPDLDQQVLQARANLATAQANQRLSATTAKRWEGLVAQDAVSRQEADEKPATWPPAPRWSTPPPPT